MVCITIEEPTVAQRRSAINHSLLNHLERALDDLDRKDVIIARLEAGEKRWQCPECGVYGWTNDDEPPRHWSGNPPLCLECAKAQEYAVPRQAG